MKRLDWIDIAKFIGIILVVSGHVLPQNSTYKSYIVWIIFLFHMPLFFIISGYVFKSHSPRILFWRRTRTLLIPYVSFIILIILIDYIVFLFTGTVPKYWSFKGFAGIALGGVFAVERFGTIWFLTCLFFVTIIYNQMIRRVSSPTSPIMILCIAALAVIASAMGHVGYLSLWGAATIPAALVCFWFGNVLACIGLYNPWTRRFFVVAILVVAIAVGLGVHFSADFKNSQVGPPILGLVLALLLSILFLWGCQFTSNIVRLPSMHLLGESSITIMMLHQLVHFTLLDFGITTESVILCASLFVPFTAHRILNSLPLLQMIFLGRKAISAQ